LVHNDELCKCRVVDHVIFILGIIAPFNVAPPTPGWAAGGDLGIHNLNSSQGRGICNMNNQYLGKGCKICHSAIANPHLYPTCGRWGLDIDRCITTLFRVLVCYLPQYMFLVVQ